MTTWPQSKRYDETMKKSAVDNWIKIGKLGTVNCG